MPRLLPSWSAVGYSKRYFFTEILCFFIYAFDLMKQPQRSNRSAYVLPLTDVT